MAKILRPSGKFTKRDYISRMGDAKYTSKSHGVSAYAISSQSKGKKVIGSIIGKSNNRTR